MFEAKAVKPTFPNLGGSAAVSRMKAYPVNDNRSQLVTDLESFISSIEFTSMYGGFVPVTKPRIGWLGA